MERSDLSARVRRGRCHEYLLLPDLLHLLNVSGEMNGARHSSPLKKLEKENWRKDMKMRTLLVILAAMALAALLWGGHLLAAPDDSEAAASVDLGVEENMGICVAAPARSSIVPRSHGPYCQTCLDECVEERDYCVSQCPAGDICCELDCEWTAYACYQWCEYNVC